MDKKTQRRQIERPSAYPDSFSTSEACVMLGGINRSTFLSRMRVLKIRAINFNENCIKQPPLFWTKENIDAAKEYAKKEANTFWKATA